METNFSNEKILNIQTLNQNTDQDETQIALRSFKNILKEQPGQKKRNSLNIQATTTFDSSENELKTTKTPQSLLMNIL